MLKYNYYLKDKNMKIFHSVSDNRKIENHLQAINRLVLVAKKNNTTKKNLVKKSGAIMELERSEGQCLIRK